MQFKRSIPPYTGNWSERAAGVCMMVQKRGYFSEISPKTPAPMASVPVARPKPLFDNNNIIII